MVLILASAFLIVAALARQRQPAGTGSPKHEARV
jgi:hypothetical protein